MGHFWRDGGFWPLDGRAVVRLSFSVISYTFGEFIRFIPKDLDPPPFPHLLSRSIHNADKDGVEGNCCRVDKCHLMALNDSMPTEAVSIIDWGHNLLLWWDLSLQSIQHQIIEYQREEAAWGRLDICVRGRRDWWSGDWGWCGGGSNGHLNLSRCVQSGWRSDCQNVRVFIRWKNRFPAKRPALGAFFTLPHRWSSLAELACPVKNPKLNSECVWSRTF